MARVGSVIAAVVLLALPSAASAAAPRIYFESGRDVAYTDVYSLMLDGSAPQRVLALPNMLGTWPMASPDGRAIAYSTIGAEDGLWLMNADGSGSRSIHALTSEAPEWSPDGRTIVFSGLGGPGTSGYGIYAIGADGGGLRLITAPEGGARYPSLSPDGSQLVYEGTSGGLWIVDADGTDARAVPNAVDGQWPSWSPDGSRIAFSSPAPWTEADAKDEIYTVRPDGTDLRRLTVAPNEDWAPEWSPDSRRIVFNAYRDGNSELYVMDADGGNQTRLTFDPPGGPNDGAASWDPTTPSGASGGGPQPVGAPPASTSAPKKRMPRLKRVRLRGGALRVVVAARPGTRIRVGGHLGRHARPKLQLRAARGMTNRRSIVRLRLRLTPLQRRIASDGSYTAVIRVRALGTSGGSVERRIDRRR